MLDFRHSFDCEILQHILVFSLSESWMMLLVLIDEISKLI